MPEQISVPTGDVDTNWNITPSSPTTHYDKIDEAWASANTSDYIHETIDYQLDGWSFPADGPAAMVTVHTVYVDLYLNTTNVAQIPGLAIYLYIGSTYLTNTLWQIDTGGAWWKRRFTFTGLSLTKAQYNQLRVKVLTVPGDPGWPTPVLTPEE